MNNKFAERLKELREEMNLSQNELAEQTGFSAACINRWEKSIRVPNVESLFTLCIFFKVSADYLIGLENWWKTKRILKSGC